MLSQLRSLIQAGSPTLYAAGMAMLLTAAITLALALLDARLLQGVSTWAKPLKLTSASLALAVLIARSPAYALPAALKHAVVLGLVLTFVLGTSFGSYLGAQRTGHWVGGALTDAGGLPLFNWSRTGGDLRVAHFFGIHAMHFVPAVAALAAATRLPWAKSFGSVWLLALAFSALTVWTFVQAARGQPFLSGLF